MASNPRRDAGSDSLRDRLRALLARVSRQGFKRGILTALGGALALIFLFSGDDRPNQLEQVLQRGSLTMLTRNGASSYYLGPEGPTGPEYVLVREFADYLGVDLEVRVAQSFADLGQRLADGDGDLVAANLSRTEARESRYRCRPFAACAVSRPPPLLYTCRGVACFG